MSSDSESDSEYQNEDVRVVQSHTSVKNSSELIFFIDFHDGYAFRQIMEFLKLTVMTVPIYFSEQGINILQGNGDGSLVVNINIKGHELLTYHFNKDLVNIPVSEKNEHPYHLICFNVSKFRDTIKSTARKEGIRMYQYAGESIVHIQVYGGNKNGEGGTSIETQTHNPIHYELSGFTQSIYQPNCKSPLSEFCNACGQFNKVKSTKYTNFTCYNKGVKVTAWSETGVISMFKKWGECDDNADATFKVPGGPTIRSSDTSNKIKAKSHNVKIPIEIIKALSKLSNLTNNGIIRIYCETDNLIRFMVSISYYAELVIYYRVVDN
jgi:hypothetical protein